MGKVNNCTTCTICRIIAGQEIMHVHLHIRPRALGDRVLTVRPCDPSNQAELAALATHIRTGLAE